MLKLTHRIVKNQSFEYHYNRDLKVRSFCSGYHLTDAISHAPKKSSEGNEPVRVIRGDRFLSSPYRPVEG